MLRALHLRYGWLTWGGLMAALVCGCGQPPPEDPTAQDTASATASDTAPGTDATPTLGCENAGDDTPCDDEKPCTVDDKCKDGACVGGVNICECTETADCEKLEDGDKCNGTLFCDTSNTVGRCRLNPATVITCPPSAEACKAQTCNPDTGACESKPLVNNLLCDDGEPCTVADRCIQGKCVAGVDMCLCHTNKDCLDDDNLCNGTPYCDKAKVPYTCRPNEASIVQCPKDAGTDCQESTCDPEVGKCSVKNLANDTKCDDGNKCTTGDMCEAGLCKGNSTSSCACNTDADCATQEDGDKCNGTLFCNLSTNKCQLNPKTVITCPSTNDTQCLNNGCIKASGLCKMMPPPPGTACEDGDKCTKGDICVGGKCAKGDNVCKCTQNSDCVDKDDGNKCNGTMFCNKQSGSCELNPATIVSCPTVNDTQCLKNVCAPLSGACTPTAIANDTACSDGDKCTTGEVCTAGACGGGTSVCTCKSNADCAAQEDGNKCNGTLFCNKALALPKCVLSPATKITCPTANDSTCVKNTCQPKSAKCWMTPTKAGTPCDDGNNCTKADFCAAGKCQGSTNVCECQVNADCDHKYKGGNRCNGTWYCDQSVAAQPKCKYSATPVLCAKLTGQPCAVNACNPLTGQCQPKANNEGKPCDADGNKCTEDKCQKGQCNKIGDKVCHDGDKCTDDNCAPASGCTFTKRCDDGNSCTKDICTAGKCSTDAKTLDGVSCNADQNGCTQNDSCKAGFCKAGVDVICQVKTGACQQPLCVGKGSNQFECQAAAKTDGTLCDDGNPCTVGSACAKGQCSGAGKEKFGLRAVAPPAGRHGVLTALVKSGDGGFVAVGQSWPVTATKSGQYRWWVQRLTPTGDGQWHDDWSGTASHSSQGAAAVVKANGGAFLVGGTAAVKSNDTNMRLVRYNGDGKAVWSQQYGTAGHVERLVDLVSDANSNATLAAVRTVGGVDKLHAVRVAATGKQAWAYERGEKDETWHVSGLARRNDGTLHLCGSRQTKAAQRAVVVTLNDDGKLQWTYIAPPGSKSGFDALALQVDGALTAVGWLDPGAGIHSWAVGLTQQGFGRWQQKGLAGSQFAAAWPLPAAKPNVSGGLVMTGTRKPLGGSQSLWVTGTDRFSNTRWNHITTQLKDSIGTNIELNAGVALTGLGKDGFAVMARGKANGKHVAVLARLDPWGHSSCAEAGKCLGKPVAFCEDDKACTTDFCDGVSECVHSTAKGLLCDPLDGCSGLSTCDSGKCPAAVNGKRFTKLMVNGLPTTVQHVAELTGGGFVAVGQQTDDVKVSDGKGGVINKGKKPQAFAAVTDPMGAVTNSLQSAGWYMGGTPGHADYHQVMARKGGGFVALKKSSLRWNQHLDVFDKEGKQVASYRADKTYGVHWLHSLVANPDGSFYLLGGLQKDGSKPAISPRIVLIAEDGKAVTLHPARWIGCALYSCGKMYPGESNPGIKTGDRASQARVVRAGKHLMVAGQLGGWGAQKYPNWGSIWLGRYDPSTQKWLFGIDVLKGMTFLNMVGLPDGGVIVMGTYGGVQKTTTVGAIARFDANGKQLWLKNTAAWAGIEPLDGLRLPSGNIALIGSKLTVATWFWWQGELSPQGELLWQAQRSQKGWLRVIKRLSDGDLLLGGAQWIDKTVQGVLIRSNPWGHGGCAAAGKCVSNKPDACDDNNPCTGDLCDPKDGCKHPVLADTAGCDDGDKCTNKDVCTKGKCGGTKQAGCK